MATGHLNGVISQLRRFALSQSDSTLTDGQLLDAFIAHGDESAFATLLRRHGSMVLGVCRRVLHNEQDAEDSFQATFVVMVRKAASIVPRAMVGNWLYGVAFRTALEAKKLNARRRAKEKEAASVPKSDVTTDEVWNEVLPLLDKELNRLPDNYRVPVVLCDLEGMTQKDAAEQLGWPQGTLSSRLFRARVLLAKRLARHGLVLSGGSLAVMLSQNMATACVPASLLATTMKSASLAAVGNLAAHGGISAKVATLAVAVQKALWFSKVRQVATCVILAITLVATGLGVALYPVASANEVPPEGVAAFAPKEHLEEHTRNDASKEQGPPIQEGARLADFTGVDVNAAVDATIVRGDRFGVDFAANESQTQAVKEGPLLKISGGSGTKQKRTLVTITMPLLSAVRLDGSSVVTLRGFDSSEAFQAKIGKDCTLQGTIEAGSVEIEMIGSGKVMLKGSAHTGTILANGSGQIFLSDFMLDRASVRLAGKSAAKLNVRTRLDYDLKGGSRLLYRGNPALGKRDKVGAAFVERE